VSQKEPYLGAHDGSRFIDVPVWGHAASNSSCVIRL